MLLPFMGNRNIRLSSLKSKPKTPTYIDSSVATNVTGKFNIESSSRVTFFYPITS